MAYRRAARHPVLAGIGPGREGQRQRARGVIQGLRRLPSACRGDGGKYLVARRLAEAAGFDEVALHVDHDERGGGRFETEQARPCVDVEGQRPALLLNRGPLRIPSGPES